MNKNQRVALFLMALAILLMLLFPPFQIVIQGSTFNMGYGFIFIPPHWGDNENLKAFVNSSMLFMEWLGSILLGSIAFFVLKGKTNSSLSKIHKRS
jgi:hypothetical protein